MSRHSRNARKGQNVEFMALLVRANRAKKSNTNIQIWANVTEKLREFIKNMFAPKACMCMTCLPV